MLNEDAYAAARLIEQRHADERGARSEALQTALALAELWVGRADVEALIADATAILTFLQQVPPSAGAEILASALEKEA